MCMTIKFMQCVLSCCEKGTYVRQWKWILSFKGERDSRCPPVKQVHVEEMGWWAISLVCAPIVILIGVMLYIKIHSANIGNSCSVQLDNS